MSNVVGIQFRKLNEKKENIQKITYKPYIDRKATKEKNILRTIKIKGERKNIWG